MSTTSERMVCKHCGGTEFHADVEVRAGAWIASTGVWVGDDGKPHFEPDGRAQDVDTYGVDYDIERYVCSGCHKGEARLAELVIPAPREDDQPVSPCGRCDHGRFDHPEQTASRGVGLRGLMPCTQDGCDCHDYYDRDVAEAGQPREVLAAVGRAA